MIDVTPLLRLYSRRRLKQLHALNAAETQQKILRSLLRLGAGTRFGREHGLTPDLTVSEYQKRVPLRSYEAFWTEYWEPAFPVVENATWPGRIPYFAVTSGTSSGRTKYIPLTKPILSNNTRSGLDVIAFHLAARPQSRLFSGKSFMLGGSTELVEEAPGVYSGDLSGIITHTLPVWGRPFSFPGRELALLADWEEKLERLAQASLHEQIRVLAGLPSWLLILLERVRTLRGDSAANPYPEMELLVHGGVNFGPYRHRFEEMLAGSHAELREVYAASEAFIAVADRGAGEGMRLNLDHGVFYEFVPLEEMNAEQPRRHWVGNLEPGVKYAVIVTTPAGLWSYILGDTVRFIETDPPRLLITGRTAYGMSAFGEHLIAEEIEAAIATAAEAISADVTDYAMGAVHPRNIGEVLGRHRYYVEFAEPPAENALRRFAEVLDQELSRLNDDYSAHRSGGVGMATPEITLVSPGGFAAWMKQRGKLGGQNKVPRIINDDALFTDLEGFFQRREA